jgi:hypothetical protein
MPAADPAVYEEEVAVKKLMGTALVCTATAAALAIPSGVAAQDVRYETVTKMEVPGAVGTAMRVAARLGGASLETVETTSIKGRRMRTDSDDSSTIVDLETGRFIVLDHKGRTYLSMTFEQVMDVARAQAGQVADGVTPETRPDPEATIRFRFAVDATNERQRIAGYDANRVFLTMEAEGEFRPEGAATREQAGTLVVLTDMWTSKDVPAFTMLSAFEDASAQHFAAQGSAFMEALAAAFAGEPGMQVAFEQSVEQARQVEGMAMRTVTHFVSVPPGRTFDRTMAVAPKAEGPSVAQQAGRAALGRLGARAAAATGRQQQDAPATQAAEPTQATILTITTEIRNISSSRLDAALFEVPAGYRPIEM